jgi:hypothetical protein
MRVAPSATAGTLIAMLLSACYTGISGGTRARDMLAESDHAVTITVENQSRQSAIVHYARVGLSSAQLGRITPMSRRQFRVPADMLSGTALLFAVPTSSEPRGPGHFSTVPFELGFARRIEWIFRDEKPVGAVRFH